MLGYNKAKKRGERLYNSTDNDPYDTGPENLKEWWDNLAIIIVLGLATALMIWSYTKQ